MYFLSAIKCTNPAVGTITCLWAESLLLKRWFGGFSSMEFNFIIITVFYYYYNYLLLATIREKLDRSRYISTSFFVQNTGHRSEILHTLVITIFASNRDVHIRLFVINNQNAKLLSRTSYFHCLCGKVISRIFNICGTIEIIFCYFKTFFGEDLSIKIKTPLPLLHRVGLQL